MLRAVWILSKTIRILLIYAAGREKTEKREKMEKRVKTAERAG